jgi:hypothetical protein
MSSAETGRTTDDASPQRPGSTRYDVLVAMHAAPSREQLREDVAAWVREREDLSIDGAPDADALVVRRATKRGAIPALRIDGPLPATADDLPVPLAGACLAPRSMAAIGVRLPSPKRHFQLARSLGRELAERHEGAAFDPQEDGLVWPRGRPRRVPPRPDREATSKVGLEWFLPAARWEQAPATLVRLLQSRCPEALPTRYGLWEPPPYEFDERDASAFVAFLLDNPGGDAFWLASRPSFGGSAFGPAPDADAGDDDERLRIAYVGVNFDGRVLEDDARWLETVVDLFVTGARELGAFFAGAQVLPGWVATRNNRLWATAETLLQGEDLLRGRLWQGLPPVPLWMSWFGEPYRDLVAEQLTEARLREEAERNPPQAPRLRRFMRRRHEAPPEEPHVRAMPDGLLVRLAERPSPRERLVTLPLPPELTYDPRPAGVTDDGVLVSGARPEDQAAVIPDLPE